MIIKKVKLMKEEGVSVEVNMSSDGNSFNGGIGSKKAPAPEMTKAIEDLKEHVIEMCELSKKSTIKICSISFSYHGEVEVQGAIVTFQKKLMSGNAVITINSPLKYGKEVTESTPKSQIMSEGMAELMETITSEAKKFVKGVREQTDLFK